jgi:hypothetical protein
METKSSLRSQYKRENPIERVMLISCNSDKLHYVPQSSPAPIYIYIGKCLTYPPYLVELPKYPQYTFQLLNYLPQV